MQTWWWWVRSGQFLQLLQLLLAQFPPLLLLLRQQLLQCHVTGMPAFLLLLALSRGYCRRERAKKCVWGEECVALPLCDEGSVEQSRSQEMKRHFFLFLFLSFNFTKKEIF